MENKKNKLSSYNGLIWLLLTEYNKQNGYTPSKYILESLGPALRSGSNGLSLEVIDSTLYDFKITSSVKDYLDLFFDTTEKFNNALIILSYVDPKYIVRDFYLANLAKQYTCWDIAYVNCPDKNLVTTDIFNFILAPDDLPTGLTEIITGKKGHGNR